MPVSKKKVHRLRKEEGLQVRIQFDSTVDGKAIKIASMIDEHTRQSLLNIVERSITAQRLTDELDKTFALWGGPPLVL